MSSDVDPVTDRVGYVAELLVPRPGLFASTDGGRHLDRVADLPRSWTRRLDPEVAITFLDASTGLAVVGAGRLVRTTDGGRTWRRQPAPGLPPRR